MTRSLLGIAVALSLAAASGCEVSRRAAPVSTRQLQVASVARIIPQPALSPVAFSPNGQRIAFSTARAIRVADLAGSSREVAPAGVVTTISWSPRLDVIAVIDNGVVWTMRGDGRNRRRIKLPGLAVQISWAPGSDRLAVVVRRPLEGRARFELWLVNRDGGFRRLVTRAPVGRAVWDLQWFADSLYLLYGLSASTDRLLTQVWRVRIAYPDRRQIPIDPPALSVRLASTGERIAYVTRSDLDKSRGRIIVARLDGTGRFAITPKDGRYTGLSWSPQGDKLAYAELIDEATVEIWLVDADGSGRLRVISYPLELPHPRIALSIAWAPDGRHLVFGTNTGTFTGPIWLANLERR